RFIAGRIERAWSREVDAVVYPPVETDKFVPAADLTDEEKGPGGYALVVTALVPYKRVELAVQSFARLGRRLLVAGDGPGRTRSDSPRPGSSARSGRRSCASLDTSDPVRTFVRHEAPDPRRPRSERSFSRRTGSPATGGAGRRFPPPRRLLRGRGARGRAGRSGGGRDRGAHPSRP